jgi:FMN phosphatase YigB (HAD superfamily)
MHQLMKPSLVVFDLDDTLYSYQECNEAGDKALTAMGAARTGLSVSAFSAALSKARITVKNRLGDVASSHSRLLYIHEALAVLGFSNQASLALSLEQEFWREYLLRMQLRNSAEDLLLALRFNHIPIALVTDLTLQIQLRKLVYLGLESFFDVVVASEESSGDKNGLAPFHVMADRCPDDWLENVWFIGDGPFDAPTKQLATIGLIRGGHGWIMGAKSDPSLTGWQDLSEIEKAIEQSSSST